MLDAMKTEMARAMAQLKKQSMPPYFLSYEVIETESVGATGSFGTLVSSNPGSRRRSLGIDLRVGSYELDSTHPIRGSIMSAIGDNFSMFPMPVDDDPDAIRAMLWYFTDQKYKRAVEQFISVKTNVQVKADETGQVRRLLSAKSETYLEAEPPSLNVDRKSWEDKVRKYTAPFQRYGNIYSVTANMTRQS